VLTKKWCMGMQEPLRTTIQISRSMEMTVGKVELYGSIVTKRREQVGGRMFSIRGTLSFSDSGKRS
jgi:hypothetical protein